MNDKTSREDLPDTIPPPAAELFAEAMIEVADALDAIDAKADRLHLEGIAAIASVKASVEEGYDRRVNISASLDLLLAGVAEIRQILENRDQDDAAFRQSISERVRKIELGKGGGNGAAHQ